MSLSRRRMYSLESRVRFDPKLVTTDIKHDAAYYRMLEEAIGEEDNA